MISSRRSREMVSFNLLSLGGLCEAGVGAGAGFLCWASTRHLRARCDDGTESLLSWYELGSGGGHGIGGGDGMVARMKAMLIGVGQGCIRQDGMSTRNMTAAE